MLIIHVYVQKPTISFLIKLPLGNYASTILTKDDELFHASSRFVCITQHIKKKKKKKSYLSHESVRSNFVNTPFHIYKMTGTVPRRVLPSGYFHTNRDQVPSSTKISELRAPLPRWTRVKPDGVTKIVRRFAKLCQFH